MSLSSLSLFPRPILTLGDTVCAAVQKVDLIKTGFVAQLHDLGFEIFHRRVGAAVLASGFCVRWSVHIGQQRHIFNPQTVDDDMHMDVPAFIAAFTKRQDLSNDELDEVQQMIDRIRKGEAT